MFPQQAEPLLVDNSGMLQNIIPILMESDHLAVDMEADGLFHFKEKVCLIQLANRKQSFIVDPLACREISRLAPLFHASHIKKIFHGSDFDIRSLFRDFGFAVNNLFDTELAARFLGYTETGLDAMVRNHFGISLTKSFQKKDWSQRPLSPPMLKYAADDVSYLIPLADNLLMQLERKGRRQWVEEECEILSRVRPSSDQKPLFTRIKGAGRLDPRSLAVLETLLKLRLTIAAQKDRPVFKVISNSALLRIAGKQPKSMEDLLRLGILSKKQAAMYGEMIVGAVTKALKIPQNRLVAYPRQRSKRLSSRASSMKKRLNEWRKMKAEKMELDPSLILSKSSIQAIAERMPKDVNQLKEIPGIRNWQVKNFGEEIISACT